MNEIWIEKLVCTYQSIVLINLLLKHSFKSFQFLIVKNIYTFDSKEKKWIYSIMSLYIFYLVLTITNIILTKVFNLKLWQIIISLTFLNITHVVFLACIRYFRNNIILIDWQPDDILFIQDLTEYVIISFGMGLIFYQAKVYDLIKLRLFKEFMRKKMNLFLKNFENLRH